jgi:hypothetical protein
MRRPVLITVHDLLIVHSRIVIRLAMARENGRDNDAVKGDPEKAGEMRKSPIFASVNPPSSRSCL